MDSAFPAARHFPAIRLPDWVRGGEASAHIVRFHRPGSRGPNAGAGIDVVNRSGAIPCFASRVQSIDDCARAALAKRGRPGAASMHVNNPEAFMNRG